MTLGWRCEPRFDRKVLAHEMPARPVSERQAETAARRWWRMQGRTEALAAARASARQPGR